MKGTAGAMIPTIGCRERRRDLPSWRLRWFHRLTQLALCLALGSSLAPASVEAQQIPPSLRGKTMYLQGVYTWCIAWRPAKPKICAKGVQAKLDRRGLMVYFSKTGDTFVFADAGEGVRLQPGQQVGSAVLGNGNTFEVRMSNSGSTIRLEHLLYLVGENDFRMVSAVWTVSITGETCQLVEHTRARELKPEHQAKFLVNIWDVAHSPCTLRPGQYPFPDSLKAWPEPWAE